MTLSNKASMNACSRLPLQFAAELLTWTCFYAKLGVETPTAAAIRALEVLRESGGP